MKKKVKHILPLMTRLIQNTFENILLGARSHLADQKKRQNKVIRLSYSLSRKGKPRRKRGTQSFRPSNSESSVLLVAELPMMFAFLRILFLGSLCIASLVFYFSVLKHTN